MNTDLSHQLSNTMHECLNMNSELKIANEKELSLVLSIELDLVLGQSKSDTTAY